MRPEELIAVASALVARTTPGSIVTDEALLAMLEKVGSPLTLEKIRRTQATAAGLYEPHPSGGVQMPVDVRERVLASHLADEWTKLLEERVKGPPER